MMRFLGLRTWGMTPAGALGWIGGLYGVVLSAYFAVSSLGHDIPPAIAFVVACALAYVLALYLLAGRRRAALGALVLVLALLNVASLPSVGVALVPGTALLGLAALLPWPDEGRRRDGGGERDEQLPTPLMDDDG